MAKEWRDPARLVVLDRRSLATITLHDRFILKLMLILRRRVGFELLLGSLNLLVDVVLNIEIALPGLFGLYHHLLGHVPW